MSTVAPELGSRSSSRVVYVAPSQDGLPEAEPRASVLRSDLKASVRDGVGFSAMVGMGESYLPAFILALGMGEVLAGLIATVPMLAGAILQLVSPWAVQALKSHRRWVVLCAAIQAVSFGPLVYAALTARLPAVVIFLVAGVYWGSGLATGPAWNTWIGTLVPGRIRASFFARRTRWSQATVFLAFLAAGFALQWGQSHGVVLLVFAVLFSAAGVSRVYSAVMLSQQSEPIPPDPSHRRVSCVELARRAWRGDSRLLIYLITMQGAVQISSPYFTPYMFRSLNLSYSDFVLLTAAAYLAKTLALPALGGVARRHGARRLMWLGGLGVIPISGLWLISDSFGYLLALQLLSGVVWAAYELAMFLLFFEMIRAEERTSVLTTYNAAHATATVIGGLAGGAWLTLWGTTPWGYLTLFAMSTVLRAAALPLLIGLRSAPSTEVAMPQLRTLSVRPNSGNFDRPILPSLAEPAEEPTASDEDTSVMAETFPRGPHPVVICHAENTADQLQYEPAARAL